MTIRISLAGAALAVALASGCATTPRSLLLGAGTGLAVGGGAGLAIGHNATGAAIGAATGALTGTLIGYLFDKSKDKGRMQSSSSPEGDPYPFLTRPDVRTILVPDTVDGNRYIEKHRVFIIEKNSSWSKDNE